MPSPWTAGHKGRCQPAWMTCQMVAAAEKRPLGRRHLSTPRPLQEPSVPTLKSCPKEPSAENEALTRKWKACGPQWALAGHSLGLRSASLIRTRLDAKTRLAARLFTLSSLPSMPLGWAEGGRLNGLDRMILWQHGHLNQGTVTKPYHKIRKLNQWSYKVYFKST